MRRCLASALAWIAVLAVVQSGAQDRPRSMSPIARTYLSVALDTLEAVTIRRDTVSWRLVRDSAFALAAGAMKTSDTYGALEWALHRANKHSFLQADRPGVTSELVRSRYGYIHIPQRGGAAISLADSAQTAIRLLHNAGACGWIVDLRDNGGGNMWPMLAGIGPLLDDSIVGGFGVGRQADRWLYQEGVSGVLRPNGTIDTVSRITGPPFHLVNSRAFVAVLFDGGTGSSGEAIVVAFRGRRNSRSFGSSSAGFTTSNRGAQLSDGANMVVTTGYNADRRGQQARDRLQPDSVVGGSPPGWPFATDRVASAAADWLAAASGCPVRDKP